HLPGSGLDRVRDSCVDIPQGDPIRRKLIADTSTWRNSQFLMERSEIRCALYFHQSSLASASQQPARFIPYNPARSSGSANGRATIEWLSRCTHKELKYDAPANHWLNGRNACFKYFSRYLHCWRRRFTWGFPQNGVAGPHRSSERTCSTCCSSTWD